MDKRKITHSLNNVSLAFLTPYYQQGRGNATTAKRIVTGLMDHQINTNVVAYDEQPFSDEVVHSSELLHVLHFRRFAEWLDVNHLTIKSPFVITSGGTDVNIDIFTSEHKEKIGSVLKSAAAITVFSEDAKQKLINVYHQLEDKIHIVNQSVWFPEAQKRKTEPTIKLATVGPNIVLPAGLRAVKDVLFVLPALVKLKKQFSNLSFTIIGAPLEQSVVRALESEMTKYPWMNYYEEVPLEEMENVYKQSDLIINTSLSEGQSSALLEAMMLGKPVVARNNGGNRSIIQHGETGYLFDDLDEFYRQVELVLTNNKRKQQICGKAQEYVKQFHSLQKEMESYISLYEQILKTRG